MLISTLPKTKQGRLNKKIREDAISKMAKNEVKLGLLARG